MIDFEVKNFIEKNILLLETDLRKFLGKALTRLRGTAFEMLINILEESKINVDETRSTLLINKFGFIFPTVYDKTPVHEVVEDYLLSGGCKTFFGLSVNKLVEFVIQHQQRWSDDMFLETDNYGTVIVRTQFND